MSSQRARRRPVHILVPPPRQVLNAPHLPARVEQHARWPPRLGSGEGKVVFATTEPDAGSNTHRLATTATRDGADYLLRGQKYYISGVDEADAVLVVAKTGVDERTGNAELSLFVVDTDAPGLVKQSLPVSVALPERQFTLHFDDVRVPVERLIGVEGDGFRQVFHGLNPERIMGAALCVGIGRYALAKATEYANTRVVWDRPIGAFHAMAKAKIEVELAALMTANAAWLHDQNEPAGEAANMAKYAAAEAALAALDAAIQSHGGNGVSTDSTHTPSPPHHSYSSRAASTDSETELSDQVHAEQGRERRRNTQAAVTGPRGLDLNYRP
ncbi:hypothetical protein GCM10023321_13430 [Pseudonocardia eucalypti]|uniref:Acyl-CoA dehydrogenase n=1 Tax=Pseudonocardia eucalypti TaxID=648755 RepID=A0ABP9PPK3_9PSEU|nr:alkylation response protein AidB-like acyl-CoA dehydrogenase [Pseudonocardia eucalypti]